MAGVSGSEPADAWVPACDSGKPAKPIASNPAVSTIKALVGYVRFKD